MSRRALTFGLIGAVALAGAGLAFFGKGTGAGPQLPQESDGLIRVAFLDGVGDEAAGDVTLILHPLATGGSPRAVLDGAAIRAARGAAYYSDEPAAAGGDPSGDEFISVLRDGAVETVYHCAGSACRDPSAGNRDLAGLLDASRPVERITESFGHHEPARKRHWKLLNDPATVLVYPPDLPAPSTIVYPARLLLELPTILMDDDAVTPLPAIDMQEYRARFTAAFAHAYPDTEAYRLGEIRLTPHRMGDVTLMAPSVSVEVIPGLVTQLQGAGAFAAMPAFTPARAVPEPGITLPVPSVDAIKVTQVAPVLYTLTYYRIVPDEPSAQQ